MVTLDLIMSVNHDVVLAEIRSWTQTADDLESSADDYVRMMERPGGTVWSGRTAEAAVTLSYGDRRVIIADADGIVGMSTNGENAMVAPVAALSDVRAMIENARRLGFDVNQDLSVSWTRPTGMSDAQAEAYENAVGPLSQQIQAAGKAWWDSELVAAETMTTEANGLTLPFDESGNPGTVEHRDGRIVLVDNERRDPDGRRGRRLTSDEVFRREEGGDRGDSNLSNDWAGRAILERYLLGGDDWTITDDPNWTRYMMDNQTLRQQLLDPTQGAAQDALARFQSEGRPQGTFGRTLHAEIENGEGVVGYQYLHGTDRTAGDFRFEGNTTVTPQPDGTYKVSLDGGYTWNDTIDPNPQYESDTFKSKIAEVITLGRADPYQLHITWHAHSTVTLDSSGNVIKVEGYPAP